jgi:hypothetical protein
MTVNSSNILKLIVSVDLLIKICTVIDGQGVWVEPYGQNSIRGLADFGGATEQDRRIFWWAFFQQLGRPVWLGEANWHGVLSFSLPAWRNQPG